ncbi:MAG: RraA family protein [Actinomycetota bacterium]|nr:RraA family protein [Actinomycetota bacterium]
MEEKEKGTTKGGSGGRGAQTPPDFSALQEELYSAVIADVLDDLGFRHQAMDHTVRPLEACLRLMGRAYTVLAADVYEVPEDPYLKELEAVDALTKGAVLVATTNGSVNGALWGELLSTAAVSKGARGAVVDGLTRDSEGIVRMGFPTFARGYSPLDSKGRIDVIAHGVPIRCGGVAVEPGDLIFGDRDGVVVAPEAAAEEALLRAAEKVEGEDTMRSALEEGMGVVEAYRRYGIL